MSALPTRTGFLRTFEALPPSTRSTAYDQAEQARDWDHRNRYDMLAAEIRLFNHVFDIPAWGDCLRGEGL